MLILSSNFSSSFKVVNLIYTQIDRKCELAIFLAKKLARKDILIVRNAMATSEPAPFPLTPIDNVMPRHHVAKLFFFPESPGSDVSAVKETLQSGLAGTLKALPLLSGTVQVIQKGVQQGTLYVAAPWNSVSDIFCVQDLRDVKGLKYAELRDKNFPAQALDRKILTPLAGIEAQAHQKPVMLVQMNIISGGIIIALCMHHSFTDGNGTVAVARIWAAYCRRENGSQLVTRDIVERERLMQGCGSVSASLEDFPQLTLLPAEAKSQNTALSGGLLAWIYYKSFGWLMLRLYSWISRKSMGKAKDNPAPENEIESNIFLFSRTKLTELKSMASKEKHSEDGSDWISTNDALCSLLRCCIRSASPSNAEDHDRQALIGIAVNMRQILDPPLPSDSIGNVLNRLRIAVPRKTIEPTPVRVTEIAHLIRQKIKLLDQQYYRRTISFLKSLPDISRVDMGLPKSQDVIGISSWSKQSYYDMDWGTVVGTRIERVRACMAAATKDFAIILPELNTSSFEENQCGLEVLIWLERSQMRRLKQDQLFNRFAKWRCN